MVTSWYDVVTMAEVSIRELKARLASYLRLLEQGEQITVTRRGRPVAVLAGVARNGSAARALHALVARGVASWSGQGATLPARRVPLAGEGPPVSDLVLEDRR